jgi:glutamate-1-semialdehyde 2,1-aminomutase
MKSYSERLHSIIPGGAHTYSRGDDQYPSNAPSILERGKGAYVWDPDGKKYLDFGMALRAVTLGYANDRVNQAAIREIEKGVNLTRATTIELQAAETMVGLIEGAEMVKFAKNGSNVTSAAVKIARAYTGRKYVCIPRQHPFFSFDDWFIGVTQIKKGIPEEHYSTTLLFDYNDIGSLEKLFDQYPGQIACVMLEPATGVGPCKCDSIRSVGKTCENCEYAGQNFLHKVKDLSHKNGALFILDEMITGFRWHLNGAQKFFGVQADISTFGKGMANGFAVAALVGKKEFMELGAINKAGAERTFLISTTHGAEMNGMGAFIETVKIYKEQNVVQHLWQFGEKLFNGLNAVSESLGLKDHFYSDGGYVAMNYLTKDQNGQLSTAFRTLFAQEMIKQGVLIPWIAPSLMHGDAELKLTLDAAEKSLAVYKKALSEGIEKYLIGPAIKPVFRTHN